MSIGVPIDRATRLLSYLNEVDLGNVLSSSIEDSVSFSLLDHGNYKHIEELSIGQRCTVALSIILENPNRILVIDQPEDHLDNEFIAKTLIKSLKLRAQKAQTIVSSHNANIPVLGNAKTVINLESNGRKGYIKCEGPVDNIQIKPVIESIMEGGKEAFQQRSDFYKN
jgi:energy-coupling factor transporter ATP-binding protein EcfA2